MWQRHRTPVAVVREWMLPAPERRAARAERRVEARLREEREPNNWADRHAAWIEAERRRYDFYRPDRRR